MGVVLCVKVGLGLGVQLDAAGAAPGRLWAARAALGATGGCYGGSIVE